MMHQTNTDTNDWGEIDVTLQVTGTPSTNYSITGRHMAVNEITDCAGGPCGYLDYFDLIYFPPLGINASLEYEFFS